MELGLLPREIGKAIAQAAWELMDGKLDSQFPLDIFQTGSGTSTNMNANEVIAYRAMQLIAGKNAKRRIHPNDHVNLGQSSNDVIPSCLHLATAEGMERDLLPAAQELQTVLEEKAREFDSILKIGRTHLQDATPIRLGQEFGGYASMIQHGIKRVKNVLPNLMELALGGTAVGTGINTHPRFAAMAIRRINEITGMKFREAENHFEAQASRDAAVEASSMLKTLAGSLMKIANDLRWLNSGPRCGIGEIALPELQPGSSIMPGKVNPVIPEALTQVCAQVIGNDTTIMIAAQSGNFELNVMMPVMAYNLLQSLTLLSKAMNLFTLKCVRGLRANEERCLELVEKSLALATALTPRIGHAAAAEIAREAYRTGRTLKEVAAASGKLSLEELDDLLDPWKMTGAGIKFKHQKSKPKD
jgi:fumarate hydratase class II